MNKLMPTLTVGGFTIPFPIIQGGMGVGVSAAGLAAAVANQGGIGVISSVGLGFTQHQGSFESAQQTALRDEIRKARSMTGGFIGLNIMIALTDYPEMMITAFDEEIDFIFLGAGLPLKFPEAITKHRLQTAHTRIGVIVSSQRAVTAIFDAWLRKFDHLPDLVVVEGPKAGGHLGFKKEQVSDPDYSLEAILPGIIDTVRGYEPKVARKIPVIAAGGIFTGADILGAIRIGADGVQMGTRFVATDECDADLAFKQLYVDCQPEDIGIIESPVGLPGRAIINKFLTDVEKGERKPFSCPWKCLRTCEFDKAPYCIAIALLNAKNGRFTDGFAFAGANAHLVREIVPVARVFQQLQEEYAQAVEALDR